MGSSDVLGTLLALQAQHLMYLGCLEQQQPQARLTLDQGQAPEGRAGGFHFHGLHTLWEQAQPGEVYFPSSRL